MNENKQFALTRPAYVGQAHLVVRDLPLVSEFYQNIIGLSIIEKSPSGEVLGVNGQPLLTLTTSQNATRAPSGAAGLFHTAFLMPSRSDLALWLTHVAHNNVGLQGASDHLVSEAIYLADPEGNGIEVYRDRSPEEWTYQPDGTVAMSTLRLNLQELYDSAPKATFAKAADGTAIGHIHLQVGDIPQADAFYQDVLGLKIMARYPGASFFGSGAYHHHVAANIWNSRGAVARSDNMTGLSGYSLKFNEKAEFDKALAALDKMEIATERQSDGIVVKDPWGIGLKLSA
ncbi:VOC family protein [Agrobacterium rosae]|uniref:Glyoxalase n=1 Tax=Agrobacterium rosae TaxID=1972867 RepID=A0AAE5VPD2_9HYPH|nr:VOC family protein [Agrobacterium rosae]KAA3514346.1 VOC family protein [Agrobacterium rosae]KAA3523012.1 VOC family protein [Agrobacterium rosae]MCM2433684.1 VOC family protein [Agrobacterium rosae]MDX8329758.1 VOC family protein [Agrobacterium rosae]MQB47720.1 VOC family protein [Agrobacterium rosae]